jgi:hypothetical protein
MERMHKEHLMSGLEDILGSALGGNAISAIAAQLGTSPENAQKAVGAALPALLGQLKDNADDPDKGPLLHDAIEKDHDGAALDDVNGFLSGGLAEAIGGKVLGHVFGGQKDSAAATVAKTGGIDMAQALRLLAILAPIVLGAMGKAKKQGSGDAAGGLGGMLGGILGGGAGGGALASVLGGLLGGSGGGGGLGGLGDILAGATGAATGAAGNAASTAQAGATKTKGGLFGKILGGLMKKK